MALQITRRQFFGAAGATGALMLAGCSGLGGSSGEKSAPASSASPASDGVLKIGTLATEDLLPLWVAQEEGLFDSLAAIEFLVRVKGEFGVSIAPTELERWEMNTPALIIQRIEERL